MKFYTKQDDGEYAEATEQDLSKVIGPRLRRYEETELKKLRGELEESTHKELTEKLTAELTESLTEKIKSEYQPKLDEVEQKLKQADITLRQKTIAAEYGFKPDLESFLGDGDDEAMRAKADILKENSAKIVAPSKETKETVTSGFVTRV